ncbi:MAG: hypothetical protein JWM54_1088 [Acidobacteriaceae bacterium]|nr:hypothetical protein [Acidobacteriaceae bacterium]
MAAKKKSSRKYSPKASKSVEREMHEFKRGKLKSGRSGKKVTNPKQAIAIGLSEARQEGAKVPPPGRNKSAKKKSAGRKSSAKKSSGRKSSAKKSSGRKTSAKKSSGRRSSAKKKSSS